MIITDSHKLFEPTHGDKYQKQAGLAGDKTGWIDENDTSFKRFSLRAPDKIGKDTGLSLCNSGLGAIAPRLTSRAFEPKTNANELPGQIRTYGIFLHEVGTAGTIQKIDLTA